MAQFFKFETEFIESLRCIPMQVRLNLDTCGVKLKLSHWNGFTTAQKQMLIDQPCETAETSAAYRDYLQTLITEQTGSPAKTLVIDAHPAWLDTAQVPPAVLQKAQEFDLTLSLSDWIQLTPLQRFALIKLSRPSHENHNFLPAMQEFGLG